MVENSMYEATDWLTEHVRAKRRDEEEADKIGDLFMSRGDLDAIEPFLGDGAKVIGHGLLVAKDGQTLAFMRLLSANGEGGAPGGAPAASATTPAPATPARPSPAPAAPARQKMAAVGNPLVRWPIREGNMI